MNSNFKKVLFVTDLDRTLIHSYKLAGPVDICVEYHTENNNKALSYMTPNGFALFQQLCNQGDFIKIVPLTTRSYRQYQRIELFRGSSFMPEYALVANGGSFYYNGFQHLDWVLHTASSISGSNSEIEKGIRYLKEDSSVYYSPVWVDHSFVFAKSNKAEDTCRQLEASLDCTLVTVCRHGEKVYILPKCLTKGFALERLKELSSVKNFDPDVVVCAGDSEFDVSMLNLADVALCPESLRGSITNPGAVFFDIKPGDTSFAEQILSYVLNILN